MEWFRNFGLYVLIQGPRGIPTPHNRHWYKSNILLCQLSRYYYNKLKSSLVNQFTASLFADIMLMNNIQNSGNLKDAFDILGGYFFLKRSDGFSHYQEELIKAIVIIPKCSM